MIPQAIDDIPSKLAALQTALTAGLPTRHVFRGCEPYTDRTGAELAAGVLNILLDREGDYATGRGRAAQEGSLAVLLVGYLQVDDKTQGKADLQDAEVALAEEIKAKGDDPDLALYAPLMNRSNAKKRGALRIHKLNLVRRTLSPCDSWAMPGRSWQGATSVE